MNSKHTETVAAYAKAARAYFKHHRVFRYRLKTISEMSDSEVVQNWPKAHKEQQKHMWLINHAFG